MKFFIFILILIFSVPASAADKYDSAYARVQQTNKIRCGYITWKPYFYLNDPNDPSTKTGIVYDLMNEIGKTLDLQIEWTEEISWGTIGEGFKTGRYDMACITMWPDAPKYKNFLLTRPLYYSAIYPWVRVDDSRFDGNVQKINAADVKVGAVDGAFTYNLAKEHFPLAEVVALPPSAQGAEYYMMVSTGKADVISTDQDEIAPFISANPGKIRQVKNVEPLRLYPHVLGIPADSPQMKMMIDSTLNFLIDNGYMEQLSKKYGTQYKLPAKGLN